MLLLATFLVAAIPTDELAPLMLEGPELHPALVTRSLDDDNAIRHVPPVLVPANPHHSTDTAFVEAIARGGSQGRLDGKGMRAALFAVYVEQNELGFYGLEADSTAEADRRELALREIWQHNVRLDRARVHRQGLVLVVVWTDGVTPACWEAVNAVVAERLLRSSPSTRSAR